LNVKDATDHQDRSGRDFLRLPEFDETCSDAKRRTQQKEDQKLSNFVLIRQGMFQVSFVFSLATEAAPADYEIKRPDLTSQSLTRPLGAFRRDWAPGPSKAFGEISGEAKFEKR
jgi:hypothetical protein